MKHIRYPLTALLLSVALSACDSNDTELQYDAEITRTEYGIPHIKANDWGSLGYGHGYAYAEDNFCVLMREIVFANGQSAELLGETDGNVDSDFIFKFLNRDEAQLRTEFIDGRPQHVQDLVNGYAAGLNRYLATTGVDNLPDGPAACRGEAWVRPITELDLWKYYRKVALQGSSDNGTVRSALLAVRGPDMATINASDDSDDSAAMTFNERERTNFKQFANSLANKDGGSNAIALGRDATQSGVGMLLGNPHQPWLGSGRWYQVHLTIPGVYDVMGATLQGLPMVGIGFNENLAWSHTVSYANRFSLFELTLNPANPLQYDFDGEWLDITTETVTAKVLLADGTTEERDHTFYLWKDGLIANLGAQSSLLEGWPLLGNKLLAFRDANLNNVRGIEMWVAMGQANTLSEFIDAMKAIGNPLFHTLAANREGEVFYGDISAIPHITQTQLDTCRSFIATTLAALTNNTITIVNGNSSACNWGRDADSPAGNNVFGFSALPSFVRTDYAANANNSYWLSNADYPLTGFPVVMGALGNEDEQQFLRTQITHQMVAARRAGTDGLDPSPLFTLSNLQELMYNNRVFGAEISLDDVLTLCTRDLSPLPSPDAEQQAALRGCAQLAQWDRRTNLDSRGAHIFTEFWNELETRMNASYNILPDETLWRVDFDPLLPLTTPREFDIDVPANQTLIIGALAAAVQEIEALNISLNAPWSELQVLPRNEIDVPIHGGKGSMGVFGAISASLSAGGYRTISGGNSYIQTVTWDASECPIAEGILTHSQSTDPESDFFADQSQVYSAKGWITLPFCDDDISASAIAPTTKLVRTK